MQDLDVVLLPECHIHNRETSIKVNVDKPASLLVFNTDGY
jgi:hypothetical protein